MSELPLEDVPAVSEAADEAAGGRVTHLTRGGRRIAAIVPESLLEAIEDAADAADADAAAWDDPGAWVPWDEAKAELGL